MGMVTLLLVKEATYVGQCSIVEGTPLGKTNLPCRCGLGNSRILDFTLQSWCVHSDWEPKCKLHAFHGQNSSVQQHSQEPHHDVCVRKHLGEIGRREKTQFMSHCQLLIKTIVVVNYPLEGNAKISIIFCSSKIPHFPLCFQKWSEQ